MQRVCELVGGVAKDGVILNLLSVLAFGRVT